MPDVGPQAPTADNITRDVGPQVSTADTATHDVGPPRPTGDTVMPGIGPQVFIQEAADDIVPGAGRAIRLR